MTNSDKISVVLASYNGEKYIGEQVASILGELSSDDELIISDDGSSDGTLEIINRFNDDRIVVVSGPQRGFVRNFENAYKYTHNPYIFFSDQDDIWVKGKREKVLAAFDTDIKLVKHDATVVSADLNVIIKSYNCYRGANTSYVKNIIKNTFTGCCMAIKREWLDKLLPIPDGIYHDWWLGVLSCRFNCARIIDDNLLLYRRHVANASSMKPDNIFKRIKKRVYFYNHIKKAIKRLKDN